MKAVLSQLALARTKIKASPIKKDAKNEYSNYNYFSPELVSKLVNDACEEANLICIFNLKHDEHGFFGEVILTDLESGESLTTIMRTCRPTIKATNETQQMGGMNTYAKRYALMSLFDIEDNTIDFDAQDNTKAVNAPDGKHEALQTNEVELNWLNKFEKDKVTVTEDWKNVLRGINKGYDLARIRKAFKVSKELGTELQGLINAIKPA